VFVMTIDQRGSRKGSDRVPELLDALADVPVVRGFERTVGDEVQGVLDDADVVVDTVLRVLRDGGWSVGVGAGPVDEPLPDSPREGSGAAFVLAREAVEAAKSRQRPVSVAVRGAEPQAAADADAVLVLLGSVAARRTAAGWDAVDALRAADEGAGHGTAHATAEGAAHGTAHATGEGAAHGTAHDTGEGAAHGTAHDTGEGAAHGTAHGTAEVSVQGAAQGAGQRAGHGIAVGAGQGAVAQALGVSQQAVSQRLRTAMWAEEVAARPAAARLLTRAGA